MVIYRLGRWISIGCRGYIASPAPAAVAAAPPLPPRPCAASRLPRWYAEHPKGWGAHAVLDEARAVCLPILLASRSRQRLPATCTPGSAASLGAGGCCGNLFNISVLNVNNVGFDFVERYCGAQPCSGISIGWGQELLLSWKAGKDCPLLPAASCWAGSAAPASTQAAAPLLLRLTGAAAGGDQRGTNCRRGPPTRRLPRPGDRRE